MISVYDVPPNRLIQEVSEELKKMGVKEPEFVRFVKSGSHTERKPQQRDFWYIRLASLLRQVYVRGTVGVNRLRVHYGGRKKHRRKPEHFRRAGGAIIRKGLQELERVGLVEKAKVGRVLTPKGRSLLDHAAKKVWEDLNGKQ